jgi:tetratricopeptide (TPR) repeat protein
MSAAFTGQLGSSTSVNNWRAYMEVSRATGRGDFAAVRAVCERLLATDPGNAFALGMLAQALAALGLLDEALVMAERALSRTPRLFPTLQLAANLAVSLGDHVRARAYVARALAADPHEHDVPKALVWFVRLLARTPGIRRCFSAERAAELDQERTEEALTQWRMWAEQYLASSEIH